MRGLVYEAGKQEVLRALLEGMDLTYEVKLYKVANELDSVSRALFTGTASINFMFYLGVQVLFNFSLDDVRDVNMVRVFKNGTPLFAWYGDITEVYGSDVVLALFVEV